MGARSHPRLQNLLAALTLNLGEEATAELDAASDLSGSAAVALLALEEFLEDAHVGRLAEVLGLTHSSAVRLVTQLERAGLAVRRPAADRCRRRPIRRRATASRMGSPAASPAPRPRCWSHCSRSWSLLASRSASGAAGRKTRRRGGAARAT